MKVRVDFVTNSSTSSYIVGVHGELTEERLLEVIGVPEDSVLYSFAKDLAGVIVHSAEKWTREAILKDYGELWGVMPKIFDSGMTCYIGDASSDGETVEQMLCYMPFHHESDDLILDSGGGY